jgi:hypothetical protein
MSNVQIFKYIAGIFNVKVTSRKVKMKRKVAMLSNNKNFCLNKGR